MPEAASQQASRLLELLDQEFEALTSQDLERFESFQAEKGQIIRGLAGLTLPLDDSPAWEGFRGLILECKERHRRNEILIQRKLDAIRSALRALQGPDPLNAVEVYDRMGRLSSPRRSRGFGDA